MITDDPDKLPFSEISLANSVSSPLPDVESSQNDGHISLNMRDTTRIVSPQDDILEKSGDSQEQAQSQRAISMANKTQIVVVDGYIKTATEHETAAQTQITEEQIEEGVEEESKEAHRQVVMEP